MTHKQTITALRTASGILMAFGAMGILATIPATASITYFMADLVFWPLDGAPHNDAPEINLLWAIAGGLLAGWGLMLWQITTHLYPSHPDLVRRIILSSLGLWFIIDSSGSILSGAPLNAVFNIGFLLMFYVPLLRTPHEVKA